MENQLKEQIKTLKEKEQLVLSLYYEKELTFKEIGEVIGVSESRISQIHSSIIIKLKKKMNQGDD
jgi:RNA polymerase sigma factor for flagellar operon FliA